MENVYAKTEIKIRKSSRIETAENVSKMTIFVKKQRPGKVPLMSPGALSYRDLQKQISQLLKKEEVYQDQVLCQLL